MSSDLAPCQKRLAACQDEITKKTFTNCQSLIRVIKGKWKSLAADLAKSPYIIEAQESF